MERRTGVTIAVPVFVVTIVVFPLVLVAVVVPVRGGGGVR